MNPLWLKFAVTQLVNIPLALLGLVICLLPYGWVPWLWRNDDDGILLVDMGYWRRYSYEALRNPVDNLKHVKGVATPGGPLLYSTWYWRGKQFYYKIGYMPHEGYPACSAGAGRGY